MFELRDDERGVVVHNVHVGRARRSRPVMHDRALHELVDATSAMTANRTKKLYPPIVAEDFNGDPTLFPTS